MAGSDCPSQVFANEPMGFSRLLSIIVKIAIGLTTRTEYTFYRHKTSDSLTMHHVSVHFIGGRLEICRVRFVGRAMPTERQAIQMAAREVISRQMAGYSDGRLFRWQPVMKTHPIITCLAMCHTPVTMLLHAPEESKMMLLGCSCNTSEPWSQPLMA